MVPKTHRKSSETTKSKNGSAQKKRLIKSVESVLREEDRLRWEENAVCTDPNIADAPQSVLAVF